MECIDITAKQLIGVYDGRTPRMLEGSDNWDEVCLRAWADGRVEITSVNGVDFPNPALCSPTGSLLDIPWKEFIEEDSKHSRQCAGLYGLANKIGVEVKEKTQTPVARHISF